LQQKIEIKNVVLEFRANDLTHPKECSLAQNFTAYELINKVGKYKPTKRAI
jgi:hypothetical protein